ncbi:YARHG domain-containing protein [Acinetobacter guillouiae]|uniref:YARHG domain-containing protein n=1 Tax=Acinetobacter guillouiae TaxID=106649 RepID=UPI002E2504C4
MNKSLIALVGFGMIGFQNSYALDIQQLQKSWSGKYDEQKIAVFIQSIDRNQVKGYSVLGKNKQNFSGKVQTTSQGYKITATESGAKASSGVFTFTVKQNQPNVLESSWESTTAKVKPKYFDLKPQQCRYQKDVGNYPVASQRLLKDEDLQIPPEELDWMRNEIYARHGYSFANKEIASQFANDNWYMPCSTNVENQLTQIEKTNIQRIKKIRPYMAKMEWGR